MENRTITVVLNEVGGSVRWTFWLNSSAREAVILSCINFYGIVEIGVRDLAHSF